MVNHTRNDRGQYPIAVGAPGSVERVKVEHPTLIEALDAIFCESFDAPGRRIDLAVEEIRKAGITSSHYTLALLEASLYRTEDADSVTGLLRRLTATDFS